MFKLIVESITVVLFFAIAIPLLKILAKKITDEPHGGRKTDLLYCCFQILMIPPVVAFAKLCCDFSKYIFG